MEILLLYQYYNNTCTLILVHCDKLEKKNKKNADPCNILSKIYY